jgi:spore coat polysaccharide biosynthesis protein SpsF (cytidylyltransferase family)
MIRYNNLKNKEFISINDKTKKYSFLRLTIDKPLDLIVVRKVYNLLKKNKFKINLRNIIKTFKLNKKIFFMNQSEIRDEGYKKNILNEKR